MNNRLKKLIRLFREDGRDTKEFKILSGGIAETPMLNDKLEEELSKSDISRKLPILNQPDLSGIRDAAEQFFHDLEATSWPTKDILLNEHFLFKNSFRAIPSTRMPAREKSSNTSLVLNATVAALEYLKQNHTKDMLKTAELLLGLYDAFDVVISLSARLSFFDSIVQYLNDKMWLLQEGLDSMLASGRLNSQLVPPKMLNLAIRDAYRDLPKSLKPLFDLNFNYDGEVHHYYSFAMIIGVVVYNNSIRIFVNLPMKAENRLFHLYEAHSLPVYSDNYGEFLQIIPPSDFVLVNKMKNNAAWINAYTLLKECKHLEGRFVCPPIMALETEENSCILNMLLMKLKAVKRLCKVHATSENLASTWIRDRNGWIYSVTRSTRLERVKEDARIPEIISVSGTGFLQDQLNTYTKTDDGYFLYPALNRMTDKVIMPMIDLTSLEELQIVKAQQEAPGNGTEKAAGRTSQRRKEHFPEEEVTVFCDPTPLWVAIIVNLLLLGCLALWVYTLQRPISHNKATTYAPSSEEIVKMNGVETDDK